MPVPAGLLEGGRIVRQQHQRAIGIATGDRPRHVLAVVAAEEVGAVIVDAGEIESGAVALDRDPLVPQHAPAEAPHVRDPRVGAGVVVVVAGDEEHSVARA
jgi:hypothetical protein